MKVSIFSKNSLLIRMTQRNFSNKVVHYKGKNINVTPHNKDLRENLNVETTFSNTVN